MKYSKRKLCLTILLLLLLITCVGCNTDIQQPSQTSPQEYSEKDKNETPLVSISTPQTPNNPNLVEQYYPLFTGAKSTPKYSKDYALFFEEVLLCDGKRALILTSIGTKSSDIKVYEIENDAVYEILKLEDDSKNNIYDYDSIFKLAMDKNISELSKFIKSIDNSHKKTILKSPFIVGTKWDDGEIVDFNSEGQLQEIKDYQYKGKPVPESDTLVVKYSDHYVFYKKGIGIIHYFYTNLTYPEVNEESIFKVNDSEVYLKNNKENLNNST